jgi:hypothetical protein
LERGNKLSLEVFEPAIRMSIRAGSGPFDRPGFVRLARRFGASIAMALEAKQYGGAGHTPSFYVDDVQGFLFRISGNQW